MASRNKPVQITGITSVATVDGGDQHSVALKTDGTVWTWGSNLWGQVGTTSNTAPAQVPGLSGVAAIAAGAYHTVALKNDGTVWAWGSNSYGQLGTGFAGYNATLVPVVWGNGSSPTVAAGAKSANDAIMNRMRGDYLLRLWGRVTSADYTGFVIDDGSGAVVTVNCTCCSGIGVGDFIAATGTLSSSNPPVLNCLPEMVRKVE
jgi:hypothetical protein